MTAEDYVATVLDEMPRATAMREQIATELRTHIAERVADGHPLDDVLRQLGDPRALAESYLSAEPLVAASVEQRALAKLLDALVVAAVVLPLAVLLSFVVPPEAVFVVVVVTIAFCVTFLLGVYTVIAEFNTGQTIGKRANGIHVVHESGRRMTLGQAVVRQLPILLSIYWIDAMFALFTDKSQRAFEFLSKTRVVATSSRTVRSASRPRDIIPGESR